MGAVLTIGLAATLACALVVLPAIMTPRAPEIAR